MGCGSSVDADRDPVTGLGLGENHLNVGHTPWFFNLSPDSNMAGVILGISIHSISGWDRLYVWPWHPSQPSLKGTLKLLLSRVEHGLGGWAFFIFFSHGKSESESEMAGPTEAPEPANGQNTRASGGAQPGCMETVLLSSQLHGIQMIWLYMWWFALIDKRPMIIPLCFTIRVDGKHG